jgi:hypothetical protein
MGMKIEESVNNILESMTQEAVDFWASIEDVEPPSLEDFKKSFSDYTMLGIASLVTAIHNANVAKGLENQKRNE